MDFGESMTVQRLSGYPEEQQENLRKKKRPPPQVCEQCKTVMRRQKKGCYICPKCGWELVFWPHGCK